jgi:hypothetical protein
LGIHSLEIKMISLERQTIAEADQGNIELFIPFFWADWVRKWGNKCRTTCMVSCAINTQLLALFES